MFLNDLFHKHNINQQITHPLFNPNVELLFVFRLGPSPQHTKFQFGTGPFKDHAYVDRYQPFSSPWLFQVSILICLILLLQEVKSLYITSHHVSGLWLTQLDIKSLSQRVDLHSKIFSSIFIYSIVHVGWLAYHLWSLKKYSFWSNCMEYRRN